MKAQTLIRGLDGLARRLEASALAPAAEAAASAAARDLAAAVTAETGARTSLSGAPGRPLVRIEDAAALARRRGTFDIPGDPALDRVLLAFARRRA